MPKHIKLLDEGKLNHNEFQNTPKVRHNIEQNKLAAAKELEVRLRGEQDSDTWIDIFQETTYETFQLGPQSAEGDIIMD